MPNGDHYMSDDRPLWQRVKDMQTNCRDVEEENSKLRKKVEQLEKENEKLKINLADKVISRE